MINTSVGQLMLNDALPEDLRDYNRVMDKKSVKALFAQIQERYPERYKDILQDFMKLGGDFASTKGASVSLRHTLPGPLVRGLVAKLREANQVDIDNDDIDDDTREKNIVARTSQAYKGIEDASVQDHKDAKSPYYTQLISGGRGNAAQLNQMSGAELLVSDHRNKLIPVPLYTSYADGVPPAEYWGSVYGTRRGVVSTKFSVAASGFYGKQMALAAHRQVVTREKPMEHRLPVGLPTTVEDEGNVGAVLAKDAGDYKAGTVLRPRILADLKAKGVHDLLVHSVLTSADEDGGVDSWSAGSRDRGDLARVGDNVGVAAAQALSEPITQSMLCLAEGTLVLMADGTERRIEDIIPGEHVMGSDASGVLTPVKVLRLYDNGPKECNTYSFRAPGSQLDFLNVTCTPDHKILGHTHCSGSGGTFDFEKVLPVGRLNKASGAVLPRGYKAAGVAYPWAKLLGTLLAIKARRTDTGWARLHGSSPEGMLRTWDIEVDHPDHLFVLANGLIVSNSSKHMAGGGTIGKKLGGFDFINKLTQGPEFFQEASPLCPVDGTVTEVTEAPQGGKFVHIGDHKLYVQPGHNVVVKQGQRLEEGDDISDGIPHPADLIKYRGVGEARRVFTGIMMSAFKDSNIKAQRRNVEPIVAGLLNHVQITDPDGAGDHVVDDIVKYNRLAATYKPRDGFQTLAPRKANGMYLEEPALHYSVGTKITSRVAKDLEKWEIPDIQVHKAAPGFQSHWERLMTVTSRDPDWQTQLGGFYVGKSLLGAVHHGATSDTKGTSYFPAVAQSQGIGQDLKTKGTY